MALKHLMGNYRIRHLAADLFKIMEAEEKVNRILIQHFTKILLCLLIEFRNQK